MPWGKHRGKRLVEVPLSYLVWTIEECDLTPALREAIGAVVLARLAAKGIRGTGGTAPRTSSPDPPVNWRTVLSSWFRPLALRYHPDRGGDGKVMAALNHAKEQLEDLLEKEGAEI
jgi:hypothetical protein